MKKIKKSIMLLLCISLAVVFVGCGYQTGYTVEVDDTSTEEFHFDALFYDNYGNHFATFSGNSFNIEPNKIKQWGWNTDGHWTSWYETSSVVSITIDGKHVQTCGSTVLFKDSRLELTPVPDDIIQSDTSTDVGYDTTIGDSNVINYLGLTLWWFNTHENGQGGEKIILIQSQNGDNIGIIEGSNITWEVAERLPKTTLINVDGKALYIHRCNFTIIDTALFRNTPNETPTT